MDSGHASAYGFLCYIEHLARKVSKAILHNFGYKSQGFFLNIKLPRQPNGLLAMADFFYFDSLLPESL
jgi:hypothetical protein